MRDDDPLLCADCETTIDADAPHYCNSDGEKICDDCRDEYCECHDCGDTVRKDDACADAGGNPVCESCGQSYRDCDDCGERNHEDDLTFIDCDDTRVCESCLGDNYEKCESCGEYIRTDDAHGLGEGGHVCGRCYEYGGYGSCDDCHELYPDSAMHYDESADGYYCLSCYEERHRDGGRPICSYSYKPDWIYHITDRELERGFGEDNGNTFFLGVELEVENTSKGEYDNDDTARKMRELAPAVCKYDGSIANGFEIVFHPQTYQYAVGDGREAMENCLGELRRRCFSGHNYGGMHVHISRDAFTRLHLVKFHQLFRNAGFLLTLISQRKPEKLDQWANFACLGDEPGCNCARYSALNYTDDTVEVRIFNSTIRTDRFFKNLETVQAAIEYSKQASLRELHGNHFLQYIMRNRSRYRNLATFLVEKHEDMTATATTARTVRQVQKRIMRRAG